MTLSPESRRDLWAHLVLLLLTTAFFATYSTHFLALRSGNGEFSGGMALLRGDLPYRNYFTAGPPLNVLKSAVLLRLFGGSLIVSRMAGVAVRLLLVTLLYRWLRRICCSEDALVAALLTIVLSAGDQTDPLASYNHDALLWAVVAGVTASRALVTSSRGRMRLLALAAGAAAALSFLTKQTVGAGALLLVVAVTPILLRRLGHRGQSLRWVVFAGVGAAVPLLTVAAVLHHLGILGQAVEMLFVRGPAAKAGRPGDFLLRAGMVASDNAGWVALGLFWLTVGWRPISRGFRAALCETTALDDPPTARALSWVLLSGAVILLLAEGLQRWPALHDFSKSVVYALCIALIVAAPAVFQTLRPDRLTPGAAQVILFWCTAALTALLLSLSWPAFEAMLLPGLGLLAALGLRGCSARQRPAMLAVFAFLAWMQVREKLDLPFSFDQQGEAPVRLATEVSHEPALRGLRLPAATAGMVDGTTEVIRSVTRAGDTVFTYPEIDLVYTLTGRRPPTFARSHNMDVVNDTIARDEAARLLASPPVVLVTYDETEADLRGAERLWRRGQISGQRAILSALRALEPRYGAVRRYELRPGDPPITVWVRRDRMPLVPH